MTHSQLKLSFVFALIFGVTAVEAGAETRPVEMPNAGFELWDADKKQFASWSFTPAAGFSVEQDCSEKPPALEGKCALKITGTMDPSNTSFQPVARLFPASVAKGHYVKLTGAIRTALEGESWAGLWMRVDANTKPNLAFDNMANRAPRGTSAWQRFEIKLPVAPNADRVVLGVLVAGRGAAWFDDLKLEVDTSMTTAAVELPPPSTVKAPPRPMPLPTLLDDAALALATGDVPPVKPEWRDDVQKRHHAIRSLWSDDFSDLHFLKPLLAGKRVVQLGESSHGVAEFNWMKVRLIKFLHQEMGFDVLAFESSLTECDGANKSIAEKSPRAVMAGCIFAVWHTEEVVPLFEYLQAARKTDKQLALAGFDTQDSAANNRYLVGEMVRMLSAVPSPLASKVADMQSKLRRPMSTETRKELEAFYAEVANTLQMHRANLREKFSSRPEEVDLAIQEARSRVLYTRQLAAGFGPEGTTARELGMADNLDFVLDVLYPKRKVIVWAHNFHITYQNAAVDAPKTMGVLVGERRRLELYTIGLFMGRGVGTFNDRSLHEIRPPERDSLEAIMANAGRKMSFVNFANVKTAPGSDWITRELNARDWGMTPLKVTPQKMFDAVIYIDTVTPPAYLGGR